MNIIVDKYEMEMLSIRKRHVSCLKLEGFLQLYY